MEYDRRLCSKNEKQLKKQIQHQAQAKHKKAQEERNIRKAEVLQNGMIAKMQNSEKASKNSQSLKQSQN
jgi:hypothetical protein